MANVYFNNPYGGSYVAAPQAQVVMPAAYAPAMAPVAPVQDVTAINVQNAKALIQPALDMLATQRLITPTEAQQVVYSFNTPNGMQNFINQMSYNLSGMAYAQDYIQQTVANFILAAVQRARQRPMTPVSGGVVYNTAPVQPIIAPNSGVTGLAACQAGTQLMMSVYGDNATSDPTPATPSAPNQKAPQATVVNSGLSTKVSVPTNYDNTLYDIPVREEPMPRPVWSDNLVPAIDPQEPKRDALRYAAYRVNILPEASLDIAVWRVKTPVVNIEDITHVIENEKRVQNVTSQVDVVDFDITCFLGTPTQASVDCYRKARNIYISDKNLTGVNNTMIHLDGSGDIGKAITTMLLILFNQAASVNFVRLNCNGGVERLATMTSTGDIGRLIKNGGDYEAWKQPHDRFIHALRNTIESSFGRIFPKVSEGYMKLTRADLRDILLIKYYNEMGIEGGVQTIMARERTAQQEANITERLGYAFTLRIERKIILHRLNIPQIPEGDRTLHTINDQTAAYLVADFYSRFGNVEMVDVSDPTQFSHPLRVGALYNGVPIVRRM